MKRFSFERAFLWLGNKNLYFSKLAIFIRNNEKSRVVNVLTSRRASIFSGQTKLAESGHIYGEIEESKLYRLIYDTNRTVE